MTRAIIHFAHANGFPARTYSKLFSFLSQDFEIGFLERHGHHPNFPVNDGWACLRDELRAEIENRYSEPIIGLGHSLGGVLHFFVAAQKPELYSRLILLDAPIKQVGSHEVAFTLTRNVKATVTVEVEAEE